MTNPTLERAARAAESGVWQVLNDMQNGKDTSNRFETIARAVLMAVRDDPPLMKVGFFPSGGMYDLGRISRDGWEDMIDKILAEGE